MVRNTKNTFNNFDLLLSLPQSLRNEVYKPENLLNVILYRHLKGLMKEISANNDFDFAIRRKLQSLSHE